MTAGAEVALFCGGFGGLTQDALHPITELAELRDISGPLWFRHQEPDHRGLVIAGCQTTDPRCGSLGSMCEPSVGAQQHAKDNHDEPNADLMPPIGKIPGSGIRWNRLDRQPLPESEENYRKIQDRVVPWSSRILPI